MTKDELALVPGLDEFTHPITVDTLKILGIKKPCTLMYGYHLNRNTVHIYFDGHEIVYHCYDHNKTLVLKSGESVVIGVDIWLPSKRYYPSRTLFEFVKLCVERGYYATSTVMDSDHDDKTCLSIKNQHLVV